MRDDLDRFLEDMAAKGITRSELVKWLQECDAAILLVRMPGDVPGGRGALKWGAISLDMEMGLFFADVAHDLPGIILGVERKRITGDDERIDPDED